MDDVSICYLGRWEYAKIQMEAMLFCLQQIQPDGNPEVAMDKIKAAIQAINKPPFTEHDYIDNPPYPQL